MKTTTHRALLALLLAGCAPDAAPEPNGELASCDDPGVREIVLRFGDALQNVPLLAPDSAITAAVEAVYAPLITDSLLAAWTREHTDMPGREVSSPWPERIEVDSVASAGQGSCRVHGRLLYMASTGPAGEEAVRMDVTHIGVGWRISGYEVVVSPDDGGSPIENDSLPEDAEPASDAAAAASVIREYYAAIDAGRYRDAYALWREDGAASGQTYDEFATGFAETADVTVDVGSSGRIEAAAGSRYVSIPVMVEAITAAADTQHFAGTYTLQRSVVDGATAAQRAWRIRSADISAH